MEETAKERLIRIIQEQPDDMTDEEILRELLFHRMIRRGLKDVEAGRVLSHEEVVGEIESWEK
ncbi:MAG: hypothetical protein A3G32_01740 [Deltaproteobacteria bacterium RIFCSPLOWO2_12_FULL_40_28]|nr:MAG: hypothetical protein A3C45_06485 [Deltaproteobacteria bacterium RIFCSPHIGHO2_02_FULL_40_28]OGQ18854.1 MAG: hypothetical protein A3E27_09120 [Deltaproteobacteria bacterium RIFCSPHIGHO2_12_FULL_40_32]OGQ40099.1 MAG: hypothetical protein A3I69_01650 [Deltaproteobacteria bacterium RIFCSPLOWO2_02_FULL_40_36]OGQ53282.1 MAG: hypothetical protein A3G32_01740 [Deltaproteobacteria bacterium RIFCSPLOWO2_12_FULL_40_28]